MVTQENNSIAIVKKYANRRLYNTQTSCYITLEDLYDMVRRGEEFEVKDAKTNEDLTRSVLTQIIFEQESKGYNLLPISFLRRLITFYDKSGVGDMVPEYLNATMENFVQNQDSLHKMSADGWYGFSPIKVFENIAEQNMDIFKNTIDMFTLPTDDTKK